MITTICMPVAQSRSLFPSSLRRLLPGIKGHLRNYTPISTYYVLAFKRANSHVWVQCRQFNSPSIS